MRNVGYSSVIYASPRSLSLGYREMKHLNPSKPPGRAVFAVILNSTQHNSFAFFSLLVLEPCGGSRRRKLILSTSSFSSFQMKYYVVIKAS
jgi:hypothetical protein